MPCWPVTGSSTPLAAGQSVPARDQADAELFALLGGWRDEMRWPPATGLVTEQDAVTALQAGLAEKQGSGRSRRGLSVVGAVAAAVLGIGGFGAVVSGAGPGDALYGLRTMFFGAQAGPHRPGRPGRADRAQPGSGPDRTWRLAGGAGQARRGQHAGGLSVGDADQKQQLFDQWNQLSAKVVERNPEATVAPGITYTVPASAAELVPTPGRDHGAKHPDPADHHLDHAGLAVDGSSSPSPSPSEVTTSPSAPGSTSPEQTPPSTTPPPTSATPSPTSTPSSPAPASTTATSAAPTTTTRRRPAPVGAGQYQCRAAPPVAPPRRRAPRRPRPGPPLPRRPLPRRRRRPRRRARPWSSSPWPRHPASAPSTAAPPTATPAAPVLTTAVVPTTVPQQPATAVAPTAEPTRPQAPVVTTAVIVPAPAPQSGAAG